MKRFAKGSQAKKIMQYYKSVPSTINKKFISRRVDAAFISSINAKKYNNVNLGIIAKKEVLSVLVIPNTKHKLDVESATSNVLAKVLNIQGEVIIGDKALRYYLDSNPAIDLAKVWTDKYNLPFVFALLCFHKDTKEYKKIDLLLVGYAGASSYPQCFNFSEKSSIVLFSGRLSLPYMLTVIPLS